MLGLADEVKFVASDFNSFIDHTKNAVIIEDGEYAIVSRDGYVVKNSLTGEEVVKSIMKDDKKTSEDKTTAQSVLKWIQAVKKTWKDEKSLHPNVVVKLMKVTAIRQGKWGYSVPGGKIPKDFSRIE